MGVLVQSGKFGTINTTGYTTMGYFVIKFVLEAYTIQEDISCYIQISTVGEIVSKAQYLSCMQEISKFYWEKSSRNKP